MRDLTEYEELLRKMLKPERYRHSLGVCDTAQKLAATYGVDEDKARTAGLLHDITKYFSTEEQLGILEKNGVEITADMRCCPFILHSYTAAYYVKNELKISDEDIFNGIYYHTTGKAGMSIFEKIIYIADLVEPNRSYPGAKELYGKAFEDIDAVLFESARFCIEKNSKNGNYIHPDTLSLYNECVGKTEDIL